MRTVPFEDPQNGVTRKSHCYMALLLGECELTYIFVRNVKNAASVPKIYGATAQYLVFRNFSKTDIVYFFEVLRKKKKDI